MVGFVDDSNGQTDVFMRNKTVMKLPAIYHKLRHNAQTWADLLGASGGALELSKCSCHLMNWRFGEKGDPVLVSTKPAIPLEVTDPLTEKAHALTFLPPHTAHKTLGHYKEQAGIQVKQVRQLRKKSETSTALLPLTRPLNDHGGMDILLCMLSPKITGVRCRVRCSCTLNWIESSAQR